MGRSMSDNSYTDQPTCETNTEEWTLQCSDNTYTTEEACITQGVWLNANSNTFFKGLVNTQLKTS